MHTKLRIFTLLLLLLASVSAMGQKQKVTLKTTNVTVEEALKSLHDVTGVTFDCSGAQLPKAKDVVINCKETPLEVVLQLVLLPRRMVFDFDGQTCHVKSVMFQNDTPRAIGHQLRGWVVDKNGQPILGATLLLQGSEIAAVTDLQGKFTMQVPELDKQVLRVSYIGMKTSVVDVTGKRAVKITLHSDDRSIDEIVVTGYQRIRRSEMVGSNSIVSGKDLDLNGTNTLEQMLQGKLSGTVVTNASGMVGTRQKVKVRGTSTLLGSQDPVWVVDGVIQTDPLPFKQQELNSLGDINEDNMDMIRNFVGSAISWLDPNDIDKITVLKDASATVLYGVKAANGVIVITTKRGKKGRLSVSYHGGITIGERLTYKGMNLMNSRERNDVSREQYERRLISSRALESIGYEGLLKKYLAQQITYEEFQQQARQLDEINTDWFNILYQNPLSHNHSISLSGGGDAINYYVSMYANFNQGTARGNKSEKYGASVRLDAQLNKKLQLSFNLNGSFGSTDGFYTVDPYKYATQTSRSIPCYNSDGTLYYYPNSTFGYNYNILNELSNTGNRNDSQAWNMNTRLQWDIFDGLRFESTLGLNISNTSGYTWAGEHSYYITNMRGYEFGQYGANTAKYRQSRLPHGGQYNTNDNRAKSYTWTNQLAYNKVFAQNHRMSILIGEEVRSEKYDGLSTTRFGYMPDRGKSFTNPPMTYESGNTYVENDLYNQMTNNITDTQNNYIGFFASSSYSFKERYTLTASIRSDASNRFGQDTRNRFLPVWSVGGRWNVVNEPWMEKQNLISDLAIRATYGWQGNVAEGYGPDLIAQIPKNSVDNRTGEYIMNIKSLAYPDLRWEKTQTYNLGLDLGLWHNRVQLSFEYYDKRTNDMIVNKQIPSEYGVSTAPINGGGMRNYGYELTMNVTLLRLKNFNWNMSINTSKNYNEITSEMQELKNWRTAVSGALNKEGYPVSSIWAFKFTGINQSNGDPTFFVPTGEECPEAVNDATAYMVYMGSLEPKFTGGLNTNIRYGNISFSASFNLNLGNKRFLAAMFADNIVNDTPSAYTNLPKEFVDRWRHPGDQTNIPGIPSRDLMQRNVKLPSGLTEYSYRMYNYSDLRVVSGSFLRCTNMSMNYIFPQKLIHKIGFKNLSIGLSVSNPFIISAADFKGVDPEVATGSQPVTRAYALNMNISL